jgi:hypothetical protein
MMTSELADIKPASPKQKYRIERGLHEHVVDEHFAHNLRERMSTGDLSSREAAGAIRRIEALPPRVGA